MLKGSLWGASDGQAQPLFKVGFQDSCTHSRKEYTSISAVARHIPLINLHTLY
jgi:hypothetical protein